MIVSLDKALVLAIHDRQLAEHGGSSGVRDDTLLESALARPEQLHAYGDPAPDLADLAAALAYGLARNHPFVDGNKRTAYIACRTFLALNGADISASAEQKYLTVLALAEGHLSAAEFAAWLRAHGASTGERVQEQPAPPAPPTLPQIPLVARASAAPPGPPNLPLKKKSPVVSGSCPLMRHTIPWARGASRWPGWNRLAIERFRLESGMVGRAHASTVLT
jgi:death-on-curing protein